MQTLAVITLITIAVFVFSLKLGDAVTEETGIDEYGTVVFLLTFTYFSSFISLLFLQLVYG